jgi:hypothetical protein
MIHHLSIFPTDGSLFVGSYYEHLLRLSTPLRHFATHPTPSHPTTAQTSCNPRFIITHLLFALHVRDRNANLKVLRRRRVFRLFMGSRRRRVCRRRAFEEECVISRLICRTVPNPSHIIHFMAVPLGLTTNYTVFLHLRRAHSQR